MALFTGSGTALITPFNKNGVDYGAFADQIDFQISGGTDALIVLGTTGEPATMSEKEKEEALGFAVKHINKRVPVIAGAGSNDTAHAVKLAKQAEDLGADGVLAVTPYYNKCTQKGLIAHFTAIADAINIPLIMYNVPGRTGVNMLPATVKALSGHKNIAAVKEACGNIEQISEIARLCGDKIDIYSGDDAITLPIMALGGIGVISVASNVIPKEMHGLCAAYLAGNIAACRELQFRVNPLVKALFSEVSPAPVKTAMNLMGLKAGRLRLPLVEMEEANLNLLKSEMRALGLIE